MMERGPEHVDLSVDLLGSNSHNSHVFKDKSIEDNYYKRIRYRIIQVFVAYKQGRIY